MAAEVAFSDILPYEVNLEIWLEIPYEQVKVLCKTTKNSDKPEAQLPKEICADPQSWVSRAVRVFKISPRSFWYRSPVEEMLPLGGNKAQGKYVELVSRRGIVSDSSYFLSNLEMVRRAVLADRRDLFDKYLVLVKNNMALGDLYHELSRDLPTDKMVTDIADHLQYTRAFGEPDYYQEGLHNRDVKYLKYGWPKYLQGLVAGGHFDAAIKLLPKVGDQGDGTAMPIIAGLYDLGDLEVLDRFPASISELSFDRYIRDVPRAVAQTPNPTTFNHLMKVFKANPDESIIKRVVTEMVLTGNMDNLKVLHRLLTFEDLDIADADFLSGMDAKMISGPFGLQFVEWLLDNEWTRDEIKGLYHIMFRAAKDPESFSFKSVYEFVMK